MWNRTRRFYYNTVPHAFSTFRRWCGVNFAKRSPSHTIRYFQYKTKFIIVRFFTSFQLFIQNEIHLYDVKKIHILCDFLVDKFLINNKQWLKSIIGYLESWFQQHMSKSRLLKLTSLSFSKEAKVKSEFFYGKDLKRRTLSHLKRFFRIF